MPKCNCSRLEILANQQTTYRLLSRNHIFSQASFQYCEATTIAKESFQHGKYFIKLPQFIDLEEGPNVQHLKELVA